MPSTPPPPSRTAEDQILEEHGHRVTRTRETVLARIRELDGNFTAEALVNDLPEVGRATVYRTIKLLLEDGLLCRVHRDDGQSFYRPSSPGHHHHLVCSVCGKTQDVEACTVDALVQQVTRTTGFKVTGHALEFFGTCTDCQQRA